MEKKILKLLSIVLILLILFALPSFAYDYGGVVGFAVYAAKGQGTWTSFNDGGTSGISISGFSTVAAVGSAFMII